MEHEHAAARADPVPVRAAEARPAGSTGAQRLLQLQRGAGNRAVGGLLRREARRRLARADAETAPAVGLPSPRFSIPIATAALDITPIANGYNAELHDFRSTFAAYKGNCADAAFETFRALTDKGLHTVRGRQPGLRTYDRANPRSGRSGAVDELQSDLHWNETKVRETVDYIKAKIDQGLPVYVGVNEGGKGQAVSARTGRGINDQITDHFLVIVGYTAENRAPGLWPVEPGGWRVTKLQAIDNAISDDDRSFPTFDVTRYSIRKPAWDVDAGLAADAEYQLTQVRVYADDVEGLKAAAAWWD